MGSSVKLEIDPVLKKFKRMEKRTRDLSPVMKDMALDMKKNVILNFDKEQSYDGKPWKKSHRAKAEGGKTLQKTSRLKNAFSTQYSSDSAWLGNNVRYAASMNYGIRKGKYGDKYVTVKEHQRSIRGKSQTVKTHRRRQKIPWGVIPAYNFLGVTDKEIRKYQGWIKDYIWEGK